MKIKLLTIISIVLLSFSISNYNAVYSDVIECHLPTSQTNINTKKEVIEYKNIDIPKNTHVKTYEDGSKITYKGTPAYEWINKCKINTEGHYMYDNCYAVAMGNYFGDVGSKYRVILDTGIIFNVIKCDVKQDKHTINQNRITDFNGAMIEFIIDTDIAFGYYGESSNGYVLEGNFDNTERFHGKIIQIENFE